MRPYGIEQIRDRLTALERACDEGRYDDAQQLVDEIDDLKGDLQNGLTTILMNATT